MSTLTSPNIGLIAQKWGSTFKKVEHLNRFDTPNEMMWLCEAASQARFILECGAHRGISTKAMCLANPNMKIVVLDAWHDAGCRQEFDSLLAEEIASGQVAPIQGTTDEGFVILRETMPGFEPDFAFIDASHTYPDVLHDIRNTLAIMPDGLISGHDFRHQLPNDGVTKSVHEAFGYNFSLPVDSIWAVEI